VKMQLTYGIYEAEIEPVLARVRLHHPLSEIEATSCPCCGAKITVQFSPDGDGFMVACSGEPPHFSVHQDIDNPPAWWRERIAESGPITFYWHEWSGFREDGTLEMKASGTDDGTHWTGCVEVSPTDVDYPLWKWILERRGRYKALISDKDLERIREEFAQDAF
jgi:hypothetical protein